MAFRMEWGAMPSATSPSPLRMRRTSHSPVAQQQQQLAHSPLRWSHQSSETRTQSPLRWASLKAPVLGAPAKPPVLLGASSKPPVLLGAHSKPPALLAPPLKVLAPDRDGWQSALKESQDNLRSEARRSGAAEALLSELSRSRAIRKSHRSVSSGSISPTSSKASNTTGSTSDASSEDGSTSETVVESDDSPTSRPSPTTRQRRSTVTDDLLPLPAKAPSTEWLVSELRSQLEKNTQTLLEVQNELQAASGDRDNYSLALAKTIMDNSTQQVELSQLGTRVNALHKKLDKHKDIADMARQKAEALTEEKQALELEIESFREHHGSGEDHKLMAITNLRVNESQLTQQVEIQEKTLSQEQDKIWQLESENSELVGRLAKLDLERMKMHNTIQELKGNIRVFCRVRPAKEGQEVALNVQDPTRVCLKGEAENQAFEFDQVFGPRFAREQHGQLGAGMTEFASPAADVFLLSLKIR